MTVLTTTAKAGPYAGSGINGPFTVPFRYFDVTHLRVVRTSTSGVESDLVYPTGFNGTNPGINGGYVWLPAPLAVGEKLTIVRNVPALQQADYVAGDGFPAESHEQALDLLTMIAQQHGEQLVRAVKVPVSSAETPEVFAASLFTARDQAVGAAAAALQSEQSAEADRAQTLLDRQATAADRIATGQDRVQTGQDAQATAADRIATGQDKQATAADRIATGQDAAATAADRTQTELDRAQTLLDRQATAADRLQTGLDRAQTGLDAQATAADRLQTGLDRIATGQDRIATGQDAAAASQSAADALLSKQAAAASAAIVGPPTLPTIANSAAMAPGVVVESAAVTVSGSASTVWPAVVRGDGTPEVQVNAGPWAQSAIFRAGDTVRLRNVSPPVGLNYVATLYAASFSSNWVLGFDPSLLFAAGEQGVWYDPSDMPTMFQDAAGTTPVTAVEQPVGLILDKSKGLVLGPELVTNGDFSGGTTGWVALASADLSAVAGKLRVTSTGTLNAEARQTIAGLTVGKTYNLTLDFSALSNPSTYLYINSSSGFPGAGGFNAIGPLTFYFVANSTSYDASFRFAGGVEISGNYFEIDNISVRELPGNHATQPTATARPILKIDGNGKHYLLFDGVDDSLSTASIDFTSTDKMSVFAGVRKLATTFQMYCELSATISTNNGTFLLYGGGDSSERWLSKGTVSVDIGSAAIAAPVTHVLTGIAAISTDVVTLRINGTQAATSAADQGTGNFGNYSLFVGSRNGASQRFNGHLYSLIIRGAQSTEAEIIAAENYVAEKTGVTL